MSTKSHLLTALDTSVSSQLAGRGARGVVSIFESKRPVPVPGLSVHSLVHLAVNGEGCWSRSGRKRLFDIASVLLALPIVIPILLVAGLAVRLTSPGPVLFRQTRIGRRGCPFTIVKFRSLMHLQNDEHHAVTTAVNQRFTPVGCFLRRWKIDELPQLWNVLVGDMSLVGARPKLPEHQIAEFEYRPGITGAATMAFANEESILACIPKHQLDEFYHEVVLPAKYYLDETYMSRATFRSDVKLLVDSVLRRWDGPAVGRVVDALALEAKQWAPENRAPAPARPLDRAPAIIRAESFASAQQFTSV